MCTSRMPHISASNKGAYCRKEGSRYVPLKMKGSFARQGAEVSGGDAWH